MTSLQSPQPPVDLPQVVCRTTTRPPDLAEPGRGSNSWVACLLVLELWPDDRGRIVRRRASADPAPV